MRDGERLKALIAEGAGESERVVTPFQFAEGYFERRGGIVYHRQFDLIRPLPDGNFLVKNPAPKQGETP